MINNEFHIIGMCVSNPRNIASKKFVLHSMRVEVDKTSGSVFTLDVLIYSTNRYIDVNKEYLGKQVAVNGFVDSFVEKDGKTTLKLVAQNILILGEKKKIVESVKAQEGVVASPDVSDDDLPF